MNYKSKINKILPELHIMVKERSPQMLLAVDWHRVHHEGGVVTVTKGGVVTVTKGNDFMVTDEFSNDRDMYHHLKGLMLGLKVAGKIS